MAEKKEKPERRVMRYHADYPQGRVFVGDEAIKTAEKDGWCEKSKLKSKAGDKQ